MNWNIEKNNLTLPLTRKGYRTAISILRESEVIDDHLATLFYASAPGVTSRSLAEGTVQQLSFELTSEDEAYMDTFVESMKLGGQRRLLIKITHYHPYEDNPRHSFKIGLIPSHLLYWAEHLDFFREKISATDSLISSAVSDPGLSTI